MERTKLLIIGTIGFFALLAIFSGGGEESLPSPTQPTPEPTYEVITLNVCGYEDEEIADRAYWEEMWKEDGVNLWSEPGGNLVGDVPACDSIELEILDERIVNETVFYKVRYETQEGWATKRLLTGED